MTLTYGVHSEAGTLRRVMVHRPGSEMARLTPANREALLFDDVIWVKQARVVFCCACCGRNNLSLFSMAPCLRQKHYGLNLPGDRR